jgi:DNA repair protein RecN (Recombination protein N)
MLTRLSVRQLAIIEKLELNFATGLTVISGETGAGKSILMDSLGLVLGERADSGMIRHGESRAEIEAEFDVSGLTAAQAWLAEEELDEDDELSIRRVLKDSGSSSAWINGRKCTLSQLKSLGELLVDIHGQHEHQSLLKAAAQRQLLDEYAQHGELLSQVKTQWQQWQQLQQRYDQLSQAGNDRESRLDWLSFQLKEFNDLSLVEGELPELEQEHKKLANAGQLLQDCQLASALLYNDETSAQSLLSQAERALEQVAELDASLAESLDLVSNASVQAQEAADSLRRYADSIDLDPARLAEVENRLAAIQDLSRKHHCEPEALADTQQKLQAEYDDLAQADIRKEALEADLKAAQTAWQQSADQLSKQRQQAATKLASGVTQGMQPLGMPNGQFQIAIEPSKASATGQDKVVFEVAMNPGQPFQSMAKVASGGELSRVSLALQVVAANSVHVPVRVFDEVDTGIGGGVAQIVGQQLQTLANDCQVLCITHLPQVASHGHQHLYVNKRTDGQQTQTAVTELSAEQRVEELARMLGGVELTDQSLAHAQEMFSLSQAAS